MKLNTFFTLGMVALAYFLIPSVDFAAEAAQVRSGSIRSLLSTRLRSRGTLNASVGGGCDKIPKWLCKAGDVLKKAVLDPVAKYVTHQYESDVAYVKKGETYVKVGIQFLIKWTPYGNRVVKYITPRGTNDPNTPAMAIANNMAIALGKKAGFRFMYGAVFAQMSNVGWEEFVTELAQTTAAGTYTSSDGVTVTIYDNDAAQGQDDGVDDIDNSVLENSPDPANDPEVQGDDDVVDAINTTGPEGELDGDFEIECEGESMTSMEGVARSDAVYDFMTATDIGELAIDISEELAAEAEMSGADALIVDGSMMVIAE